MYDPVDGTFATINATTSAIRDQTTTLLADGRVLLAGGTGPHGASRGKSGDIQLPATAAADIFDPATNTFHPTESMGNARRAHTATLLPDGSVLVAGGIGDTESVIAGAELYR